MRAHIIKPAILAFLVCLFSSALACADQNIYCGFLLKNFSSDTPKKELHEKLVNAYKQILDVLKREQNGLDLLESPLTLSETATPRLVQIKQALNIIQTHSQSLSTEDQNRFLLDLKKAVQDSRDKDVESKNAFEIAKDKQHGSPFRFFKATRGNLLIGTTPTSSPQIARIDQEHGGYSLFNLDTGVQIDIPQYGSWVLSHDGNVAATKSDFDDNIVVTDFKSGETLRSLTKQKSRLVAMNADGSKLAITNQTSLVVIDTKSGAEKTMFHFNESTDPYGHQKQRFERQDFKFDHAAFTRDGKHLMTTSGHPSGIMVFDVSNASIVLQSKLKYEARGIVPTDGTNFIQTDVGKFSTLSFSQGKPELIDHGFLSNIAGVTHYSSTNAPLITLREESAFKTLRFNGKTFDRLPDVTLDQKRMFTMAIHDPTGRYLATVYDSDRLVVYDLTTGEEIYRCKIPRGNVTHPHFGADSKTVYLGFKYLMDKPNEFLTSFMAIDTSMSAPDSE